MKEDTKKLITVAAIGGVGLYLLTRSPEDSTGMGGGGGIPLLPGDIEDAGEGDTIINYILGGGEGDPFGGFAGWGGSDREKAVGVFKKYEAAYAPAQKAYEKSISLGAPTSADVAAYGRMKKAIVRPAFKPSTPALSSTVFAAHKANMERAAKLISAAKTKKSTSASAGGKLTKEQHEGSGSGTSWKTHSSE